MRSLSCAGPRFASCCESFANTHYDLGWTLRPTSYCVAWVRPKCSIPYRDISRTSRDACSLKRYSLTQESARPRDLLGLKEEFIEGAITNPARSCICHKLLKILGDQLRFPPRTVATDQVAYVITDARIFTPAYPILNPVPYRIRQGNRHHGHASTSCTYIAGLSRITIVRVLRIVCGLFLFPRSPGTVRW